MKVDYLKKETIESEANQLILEFNKKFGESFGEITGPPIPVDQILESLLELKFEIEDLKDGILGALSFKDKQVWIDVSLDPDENPRQEGRFHFTVSHEIGHWQLHRQYFIPKLNQGSLFEVDQEDEIVCRAVKKADPIEWQANHFAGCLLMPSEMVRASWIEKYGRNEPYVAVQEMSKLTAQWGLGDDDMFPTVDIAKEIARDFKVSGQAMQIKLLELGLILPRDHGTLAF